MHSTKFGSVKALSLRTNSCKRRCVAFLNPTNQAKNAVYIASSGLCESKRFVLEQSWKKIYSRTTTKSLPLLLPGHGFFQQNGPESGHVLVYEWKNGGGSRLLEQ